MSFFIRGKQMIVHDPRLCGRKGKKGEIAVPLKLPVAKQVWQVSPTDTSDHITGWTAQIASEWGTMDALHFMAHGAKGYVEIGAEGFSMKNVELFERYGGRIKNISFLSCLVGSNVFNPSVCSTEVSFAQRVAQLSGARVIVCKEIQKASVDLRAKTIDYGDFEGDVYVIQPDGCTYKTYNSQNGQKLNLEKLIFGYSLSFF